MVRFDGGDLKTFKKNFPGASMTVDGPFFSIITVCFRDKDRLAKTIASVEFQTFKNFEYIVIDGGSNDGTDNVVKNAGEIVSDFISEPDNGIYDAMNKGLIRARGKYALFLNAGDTLVDESTLDKSYHALQLHQGSLGLLCPVLIKYPGFASLRLASVRSPEKIWKGLPTSHQGILYRLDAIKKYPFNISFKLAADFDQYIRMTNDNGRKMPVADFPLSKVEAGGVSDLHRSRSRNEYKKIIMKHLAMPENIKALGYQYLMMIYDALGAKFKSFLPTSLVHSLRLMK